ncbi:hypothetical protein CBR_g12128 [Chara braunii]|uniref:Uncharacterized protein n=1 Tax=Chara braunii TaxID=69332 RepID=A0A388KRC7_CHABU|nr:hypothetical protein CBR_g12128 [Chara braunii]|eukprot:GBG72558.1 hypothetical protein CBR_g12128 [Chara braunii]
MAVTLVCRGHVYGRTMMVYELSEYQDVALNREFTFVTVVTRKGYRRYEVDAQGEYVLRFNAGLGYAGDDLRDAIVYVTKMHEDVPNAHVGAGDDIVEKIVRMLLSVVAMEHDGRMAGLVEWEAILDPPLVGRPYMQGELPIVLVFEVVALNPQAIAVSGQDDALQLSITVSPTVGLSPEERLEVTVCKENDGDLQAEDGYGSSRTLRSEGTRAEEESRGGGDRPHSRFRRCGIVETEEPGGGGTR